MNQFFYIKNKLSNYQKLLITAMVMTPFTALRPTFIGFGELVFIIVFFYEFKHSINKSIVKFYSFSKFWLTYISLTLIGIIFNGLFLDFKNVEIKSMIFDFASYVVVFMTCFIFEKFIYYKKINTYQFLKYSFLIFSIILSILYFISFYRSSLFGYSLIYANTYFVPFTDNLHQISMFLTPLIFVGILLLKVEKNKVFKIFIVSLITIDVIMDFNVGSAKAILGIYTGSVIIIIFSIIKYFKGNAKLVFLIITFIFLIPLIILNSGSIKNLAVNYFDENDGSDGREILYTDALKIGMGSPVFGHGPGPHIPGRHDKLWDAHQTFLAVFLQTGLLGIVLILLLFLKIMKRLINNPILFAAFIPIFIYASGGDVLRKLSIWIFLILFYYYDENDEIKKIKRYINSDLQQNNE